MKEKKIKKFKKVVKYYYPNEDIMYNGGYIGWILINIVAFFILWIFFPVIWINDKYYGKKEVYYIEIKEKGDKRE